MNFWKMLWLSLSYPLRTPNAIAPLMLGLACLFVPGFNLLGISLLLGYGVTILRNVYRGETTLPAFRIGENLVDGILIFMASIPFWFVPALIYFDGYPSLASRLSQFIDYYWFDRFDSGVMFVNAAVPVIFFAPFMAMFMIAVARYAMNRQQGALFNIVKAVGYTITRPLMWLKLTAAIVIPPLALIVMLMIMFVIIPLTAVFP